MNGMLAAAAARQLASKWGVLGASAQSFVAQNRAVSTESPRIKKFDIYRFDPEGPPGGDLEAVRIETPN